MRLIKCRTKPPCTKYALIPATIFPGLRSKLLYMFAALYPGRISPCSVLYKSDGATAWLAADGAPEVHPGTGLFRFRACKFTTAMMDYVHEPPSCNTGRVMRVRPSAPGELPCSDHYALIA